MRSQLSGLKGFLSLRMYRHQRVLQVMQNAQVALTRLFDAFMADPHLLPRDWLDQCQAAGDPSGSGALARANQLVVAARLQGGRRPWARHRSCSG